MGSMETLSNLLVGVATLILGVLALFKPKNNTLLALGLLWVLDGLYCFVLVWQPEWNTIRDFGSYFLFIAAFLWIGAWKRGWFHASSKVSPHSVC